MDLSKCQVAYLRSRLLDSRQVSLIGYLLVSIRRFGRAYLYSYYSFESGRFRTSGCVFRVLGVRFGLLRPRDHSLSGDYQLYQLRVYRDGYELIFLLLYGLHGLYGCVRGLYTGRFRYFYRGGGVYVVSCMAKYDSGVSSSFYF